ncbi:DUF5941 domain-containing protein [Thermopolyspora sp. NPDC052614]|uniref:DUF5941 domain-containing protein n=1 Tax=Thermopolyspora sp. NPDC052614 TaxID=3155682 RepID=UPI0034144818
MITQPQTTSVPAPDPDEERLRIQTARLVSYRDDGPLATLLRDHLGPGLPPVFTTLVALIAVAALGFTGTLDVGTGPIMLVPALIVVALVVPTMPRDHLGRFDWLVPPLVRAVEFLTILLVALAADAPKWLLFVLIYVIGYHTYDTVYRTRQSIWPPAWVFQAGLGWECRLLIIGVGAAIGQLTIVMAVLTAYLAVLFAVESITSWVRLDKSSTNAQASDDLEAAPEEAVERASAEADKA